MDNSLMRHTYETGELVFVYSRDDFAYVTERTRDGVCPTYTVEFDDGTILDGVSSDDISVAYEYGSVPGVND